MKKFLQGRVTDFSGGEKTVSQRHPNSSSSGEGLSSWEGKREKSRSSGQKRHTFWRSRKNILLLFSQREHRDRKKENTSALGEEGSSGGGEKHAVDFHRASFGVGRSGENFREGGDSQRRKDFGEKRFPLRGTLLFSNKEELRKKERNGEKSKRG